MEDFGDILYILAMLAALVFSALRKKKQVKERPNQPVETSRSPFDPFEEDDNVFDELKEIFRPEEREVEPAPVIKEEKPKEVLKRIEYKKEKYVPKKVSKTVELIALEEDYDDFSFIEEEVDIRKAVIYSEILNRPYQ